MAFANLFKTLSPAEEHHAVPCEAPHPHKNGVQEACPPRRQKPDGQKKRKTSQHLNQAMTAKTPRPPPFYDYDHPDGVPSGPAHFKRRGRGQFHHRGASSQPPMDQRVQRQQFQNTTTFKQEMQQQNMGPKKRKTMKNNKQQENACRSNRGGFHQGERREWFPRGRGGRGRGQTQMHQHMRDPAVERVRSMTQEFKDQNALEAEGQLLCKHFLMGRCNKGEECQLVHRSAHNDLIKEVCKFYVQGACFKEESCAYMHSSFPCKFFHQRGKCLKEEDCRFSHEPLTDLSKQLLDQALQREKDLSEMAKKSQQEGVAPPAVEDQKGAGEEASGPEPHILLHPIRPQFYNSSCPEEPLPERQGLTGTEPGRGPAPPSCCPPNPKAVPYSVEAVLGPVISKPFPTLFGSSRDLPSASPPRRSCAPPPAPAHREAPYSVEAVLRSVPSVGGSTLTSARDPPPSANLPLTYYGSDSSKEFPKPSWFSGLFSGEDLCLKHDTRQAIEAKARPNGNGDVPPWNQDHQQAERCLPVSQRVPPCSQSSSEGLGVGHANRSTGARVPPGQPDTPPAKGTQKAFRSLFANPLNQNVFNPPHLAPLPAAAPSPTRATPSTNRKEKTSADADTNTGHNTHVLGRSVTVKPAHRPSEVAPPAVPPGSELRSTESPGPVPHAKTARSVSKPAPCDGCVLGRSRPVKRPYHSRTAGSGRGSREEPPPSQITTDLRAEAVTAPGGVLRGLFATPIHQTTAPPVTACAAPPHPGGGSSEHHPQNSRATGSPASRPDPKHPKQKERKSRSNNHQPPAHSVQKDSDMPEISSDKAPSHDATNSSNSVLKTLFLNLRPYNQEEERLIHSKSGDKEEIKHRAVSKERQTGEQRDEEEETRRKETRSTEMFVAVEPAGRHVHPDHQLQGSGGPPSLPPARLRPLGQSPPTRCPGPSGGCPAGRLHPIQLPSHSAVHPPIGSTGPLAQPQTSVEGPLRSLFKTLDPAASPFGS